MKEAPVIISCGGERILGKVSFTVFAILPSLNEGKSL